MKNFTLAEINKSIPYIPALRPYVGSVAACILMQQLDYWFSIKSGVPFYKFLAAQNGEKSHPSYKPGDSWCEELSISPDEFRSAFDKIGYRYKSFTEYKQAREEGDTFRGFFYASYHDKIKGLTWYLRNHNLVDALLFEIFTRKSGKPIYVNSPLPSTEIGKAHLPKSGKPIPNISEITQEITAENTTTKPVAQTTDSLAEADHPTLTVLLNLIPTTEHSSRLSTAIFTALATHDEDYVRSNIQYCLTKHRPDDGKNSLGGMIIASMFDDYAEATRIKAADQAAAKARIEEERRKQDEYEKLRIKVESEEALRWSASSEGKQNIQRFLS